MGKTLLATAAATFVAAIANPAPVPAGGGMWVPQQLAEIAPNHPVFEFVAKGR